MWRIIITIMANTLYVVLLCWVLIIFFPQSYPFIILQVAVIMEIYVIYYDLDRGEFLRESVEGNNNGCFWEAKTVRCTLVPLFLSLSQTQSISQGRIGPRVERKVGTQRLSPSGRWKEGTQIYQLQWEVFHTPHINKHEYTLSWDAGVNNWEELNTAGTPAEA